MIGWALEIGAVSNVIIVEIIVLYINLVHNQSMNLPKFKTTFTF